MKAQTEIRNQIQNQIPSLSDIFVILTISVVLVLTVLTQSASANSTTGHLENDNNFPVVIAAGKASHGETPKILNSTVDAGSSEDIFIANSDGAGVEGYVTAAGNGVTWTLKYDNPVVGSNSCGVTSPTNYKGSCNEGSGTNNTDSYKIYQQ